MKNKLIYYIDNKKYEKNIKSWYSVLSFCGEVKPFIHRSNGPALIWNEYKVWYEYGKLHRKGYPAVIYKPINEFDLYKYNVMRYIEEWWINGKRHRLNGPAATWSDSSKEWYSNGERHRLDGPAVMWYNGNKEWWIKNKYLDSLAVETWFKENNIDLKKRKHQVLFMLRFG